MISRWYCMNHPLRDHHGILTLTCWPYWPAPAERGVRKRSLVRCKSATESPVDREYLCRPAPQGTAFPPLSLFHLALTFSGPLRSYSYHSPAGIYAHPTFTATSLTSIASKSWLVSLAKPSSRRSPWTPKLARMSTADTRRPRTSVHQLVEMVPPQSRASERERRW